MKITKKYNPNDIPLNSNQWTARDYWSTWRWLLVAIQNGEIQTLAKLATTWTKGHKNCIWCVTTNPISGSGGQYCRHRAVLDNIHPDVKTIVGMVVELLERSYKRNKSRDKEFMADSHTLRTIRNDSSDHNTLERIDRLAQALREDIRTNNCPLPNKHEVRLRARRITTHHRFPMDSNFGQL